jgi:hypothetical protein
MPLDLVAEIAYFFFAIMDFLRLSLLVAIPAFPLVLAGQKLNAMLKKRFKASWIATAFASTFLILLPIVFIAYLSPYIAAYASNTIAGMQVPETMQLTAIDYAMAIILTILKNLFTTFVFAVLLMPLLFFASYAEEKLKEKLKIHALAITFLAILITAITAWIIILFIFPWIYVGLFELLWWGGI